MEMLVPSLVALIAVSAPAVAAPGAERAGGSRSTAIRYDSGSSAVITVSARIISASARVGVGRASPLPRMVPRRTTVSAADGRPVAALVYDFE